MMDQMKEDAAQTVLVLGASGMLGHTVLSFFNQSHGYQVWGSARSAGVLKYFPAEWHDRIVCGVDVENTDSLARLLTLSKPDVVINCIGLIKQLSDANDPLVAIPINALLPHRLARLCDLVGARLIHISTDCVFSGAKGMYHESDESDARDLYGRTKYLGEVGYAHAVTLRTSIIGPELGGANGLVAWFLAQQGEVKGFDRAIFSGLPTVELARVMRDFVVPDRILSGVYHVSAAPISKFDLLNLLARTYRKDIAIAPESQLVIDRSLDSSRFRQRTGYAPASWPELVAQMRDFG